MSPRSKRETSIVAENAAREHLQRQGYRVLETNFACAVGEIDIVARQGGQLVFVEVRSHASDAFGLPRESIGPRKIERLSRAAVTYIKRKRLGDISWRFDAVEVLLTPGGTVREINVIPDAFEPRGIF